MAFLVRTIDLTATGREIARERELAGSELTIGRDTANDLHLPDLAIDPSHARIRQAAPTRVEVESIGNLAFTLDGVQMTTASVNLRTGAELRLGGYSIVIGLADNGATLLTVREEEDDLTEIREPDDERSFGLERTLPGKRVMAWSLLAAILLAFLAVPVFSNLSRASDKPGSVTGDAAWVSGDLSQVHHGLKDQCVACHVKPFEAVQDKACLTCHKDVHDHAAPERLAAAEGSLPLGSRMLWSVAHTFGKPGPGACTDCHTEHEGDGPISLGPQQACTDCHGDLSQSLPDTKLGDAGDFGRKHPQFTPLIATVAGETKRKAISLDRTLQEESGLAFPHKLHLDPQGGVARMAKSIGAERGYGSNGMACKDCHRPSEDGVRFKPIEMEEDCEVCHSLVYDRVGSTYRTLRHGDVAQMQADLQAHDRSQPVVSSRKRPGQYASGHLYYSNFTPSTGGGILKRAFGKDGVCGDCHTPTTAGGKLGVVPVHLPSRYMMNGWFDHKDHVQETCTSCHAATQSTKASDVLLPGIAQCRTCHLGEDDHKAKVPSGCAMCHSYHQPALPKRQPSDVKE